MNSNRPPPQSFIIGDDGTSFARANVFIYLKTENRDIPESAYASAMNRSSNTLGAVLDQVNSTVASHSNEIQYIPRCAVHMRNQNRRCSRCNLPPHVLRINAEGFIDISQNRDGTEV